MKKLLVSMVLCALVVPAFAAGRSVVAGNTQTASRSVVISASKLKNSIANQNATANANDATVKEEVKTEKVNRDKERLACLKNNIGIGNTFVWASKYSNTGSYSTMVEDTENPENNVCFVLVGMRSEDTRVNTADVQPRYFEWGQTITCGDWIDKEKMRSRILDAKKSARTWGTVAGAVGSAGVGVGAMELFGNKLIGGAVQGQVALKDKDIAAWYNSKALELKAKNETEYNNFVKSAGEVYNECKEKMENDNCKKYKDVMEYYKVYHLNPAK